MIDTLPPGRVCEDADGHWIAVADDRYGGHRLGPFASSHEAWDALLAACPEWPAEYVRLRRDLGGADANREVIDISFDFTSDAPPGKDPDTWSPTLRRYHQLLWSKPLPGGALFELDAYGPPPYYLHHRSELGEFWLSSDVAVPNFLYLPFIVDQVSEAERKELWPIGYTIGGSIVFPATRGRKMTLNGARAWHPKIRDRFDLTVECIRRHYLEEPSPLSDVLARYTDFFGLFGDFSGYVDFFHLQDLVNETTSSVRFFMPFEDFAGSPLPATLDAYREYCQQAIEFIQSRNRRLAAYVAKNPPAPVPPPWASSRFKAVLAHAGAVGQLGLLVELLAAGDRLGLYLRSNVGSVMFTPPRNRSRMLFTVWPNTSGMHMWVSADTFEQFFPEISADEARHRLGPDGERQLDQTATRKFIADLERLLEPTSPWERSGA